MLLIKYSKSVNAWLVLLADIQALNIVERSIYFFKWIALAFHCFMSDERSEDNSCELGSVHAVHQKMRAHRP